MELDEQSKEELLNSELEDNIFPEENIQHTKQPTDFHVNIYIWSARTNKLEV
jgi:hypothetical protein